MDQPVLSRHTAPQVSYMVDDEVDSIFPLVLKIPTSVNFRLQFVTFSSYWDNMSATMSHTWAKTIHFDKDWGTTDWNMVMLHAIAYRWHKIWQTRLVDCPIAKATPWISLMNEWQQFLMQQNKGWTGQIRHLHHFQSHPKRTLLMAESQGRACVGQTRPRQPFATSGTWGMRIAPSRARNVSACSVISLLS